VGGSADHAGGEGVDRVRVDDSRKRIDMSALPKKLTVKQETISPAIWYVYEGDQKLCITSEANAKFFVALNDEVNRLQAIEEAVYKLAEHPDSEAKKAALLRLVGVEL
jgi:hypothetical protein